jgi:BirA family biotin operon repressor/biotin-[acetyl-CoA-carboxylase] ligase
MIGQWTHQWLEEQGYLSRYFESTTSTNLIAKENAANEPGPLTFYVADQQTLGRGQGNHKWLNTAPGTNLLLTWSIDFNRPPQPELCVSVGEQLKDTCSLVWPDLRWQLKLPNDLLLYEKKIAGILLESISQGHQHRLLLGLGFNALDFPKSQDFLATSLQSHLPQPLEQVQWNQFLSELFRRVTENCLLG